MTVRHFFINDKNKNEINMKINHIRRTSRFFKMSKKGNYLILKYGTMPTVYR